jgi:peptide deformylase
MQEGCLSIPGIVGDVRRSSRVVVEAYDMKGNLFRLSAKGFLAQIIQHENDHLDGILFDTKATNLREI